MKCISSCGKIIYILGNNSHLGVNKLNIIQCQAQECPNTKAYYGEIFVFPNKKDSLLRYLRIVVKITLRKIVTEL